MATNKTILSFVQNNPGCTEYQIMNAIVFDDPHKQLGDLYNAGRMLEAMVENLAIQSEEKIVMDEHGNEEIVTVYSARK